jgi:hypothetical protein
MKILGNFSTLSKEMENDVKDFMVQKQHKSKIKILISQKANGKKNA